MLFAWTLKALSKLSKAGYLLLLVSNQPSYAKGKTTLKNIKAIHAKFHQILIKHGICFTEYYYCYHHPEGIVPSYSKICSCRKPSPAFLLRAGKKHAINLADSWMIGDRDSDIRCGQQVAVKTILIRSEGARFIKNHTCQPDFTANNIKEAADIILAQKI
jgi:D-glycero-D-manno-heptose 1,7-bisphosphate phosphatase